MQTKINYVDRFHDLIDDEFEARACKDIDDDACKVVPGNYLLMTVSLVLTKMADTFASAKIVLPWLMTSTGAPIFLISLLVPIRESGSMLPQLFLGAYIRRKSVRKTFLVLGAILQALVIAGLALVAVELDGISAGVAIVLLTVLFSLARAISSIANKDVIGKTVPKNQRGKLSGTAASIAGFISIGFGVLLIYWVALKGGVNYLLVLSAVLFAVSGLTYSLIKEYSGATDGAVNGVFDALKNIKLLVTDSDFSKFVLVRGLMISSGLAAPYFVLMTQSDDQSMMQSLGSLIVVGGIASFVSGNVWGRLADKNSKQLMTLTALLSALICGVGGLLSSLAVTEAYIYLGLFFVLSVVHEGVRQGRKTYIVDMAGGNKRTDYVSVSNTLIGVLLLVVGLISGLIAQFSTVAVLLFFAICSALAAVLSLGMKNVSE